MRTVSVGVLYFTGVILASYDVLRLIDWHPNTTPPQWQWCAHAGGTLFTPHNDPRFKPYCLRLEQVPDSQ